jgi:hypothetical protein
MAALQEKTKVSLDEDGNEKSSKADTTLKSHD